MKINPKDLLVNTKVVSKLSDVKSSDVNNLDTINETACNGETNMTCFETEGDKCPGDTFASKCLCQSDRCSAGCESNVCTKTQGEVCCAMTKYADCPVKLTEQNCADTFVCPVTNINCTVISDEYDTCTCPVIIG